MHPRLSASLAAARVQDLRTAAERRGVIRRAAIAGRRDSHAAQNYALATAVTIRPAHASDTAALARLAQLDSQSPPVGPVLVADVEGELWAALVVDSGRQIADPFRATTDLRALLRARARHLAAPVGGAARPARSTAPRPSAA